MTAERLQAFRLDVDEVCRHVDTAIEAFAMPEMLPPRPRGALEASAFEDNLRAGNREAEGMALTATWLRMSDETHQRNRAAFGALLWSARQYRDVLPEEMHGDRGKRLSVILVNNWGLRCDVPMSLAECRVLSNAYGTARWGKLNRRRAPGGE